MTEQQIIATLATVLFFSILVNAALMFVLRKAMRAMDRARAALLIAERQLNEKWRYAEYPVGPGEPRDKA